ncbi:MAG TPA: glycoside hydrolase domain-containing protein [Myxococcales bacterium]|nr:glycoside hydrolase domain-containing protein [Myxococcales bacterium]
MTANARHVAATLLALGLFVACGQGVEGAGVPPFLTADELQVGPAAAGLDRASVLSVAEAKAYKSEDGIQWSGAYIGGACNAGSGWDESALIALSQATGWQFMPIYVGQNGPGLGCPCNLTSGQGTADGADAVSIMKSYHWAPNAKIPVVLDVEAETYGNDPSGASAYVRAWLDAVHAGGYLGYVYSNPDGLDAFKSEGLPVDGAWVANYPDPSRCFEAGLSPFSDPDYSGYRDLAWQYTDCSGSMDYDTADLLLAPAPGKTNLAPETYPTGVDQVENNGGMSAVTWADGHVEVFVRESSGKVLHAWTDGTSDQWHAPADLDGMAHCGVAAVDSYAGGEHAEVFDSSGAAGDTRASDYDRGWTPLADFGGKDLVQPATLRWSDTAAGGWKDGRTEVFALSQGEGRLYHRYYDPFDKRWSTWESLGGSFATGASAILAQDGDGVLFATDAAGQASYDESHDADGSGWLGWKAIAGGPLSSRPVAVRDADGVLRLFARGQDGRLYGAHSTAQGFSQFEAMDTTFALAGEPAAALDDGVVTVFVRGVSGRVSRATLDAKTHVLGKFASLSTDQFASDPFAWQGADGRDWVFAVTANGHLDAAHHTVNGWKAFVRLATGVDSCVAAQIEPQCPAGDGLYCGGHGVKGNDGTLYACKQGKLTTVQSCAAGCEDEGKGGEDQCKASGGTPDGGPGGGGQPDAGTNSCASNADCPSDEVCEQPAIICGGETGVNQCTADVMTLQGQACSNDAECNVVGGTTLVCAACPAGCGGNCCQIP